MRFIQSLQKIGIGGLGKGFVKPQSPTLTPKGEGNLSFVGVEDFQPLQEAPEVWEVWEVS